MQIIAPIVHLNGTSKAELLEQLRAQADALQAAIRAMREGFPHMRDYYPIGFETGRDARHAQGERIAALQAMRRDIVSIASAIQEGKHGRLSCEESASQQG